MLSKAIETTKSFFEQTFGAPIEITGIVPNNEGFELIVEMLVDEEYTKKRAKKDLIAIYKVLISNRHEVISFKRQEIRERGKPIEKEDI